jgi:hypothetical protein
MAKTTLSQGAQEVSEVAALLSMAWTEQSKQGVEQHAGTHLRARTVKGGMARPSNGTAASCLGMPQSDVPINQLPGSPEPIFSRHQLPSPHRGL